MKQKLMLGFVALGLMMPQMCADTRLINLDAANKLAVGHERSERNRRMIKWTLAATALAAVGGTVCYFKSQGPTVQPVRPIVVPDAPNAVIPSTEMAGAVNANYADIQNLKTPSIFSRAFYTKWLITSGPSVALGSVLTTCGAALGNTMAHALRLPKMVASAGGLFAPETVQAYVDTQTNLTEANSKNSSNFSQLLANAQIHDIFIVSHDKAAGEDMLQKKIAPYNLAVQEACNRLVTDLERVAGFMLYQANKIKDSTVSDSLQVKAESLIEFCNTLFKQIDEFLVQTKPGSAGIAQALAEEVTRRVAEFDLVAQYGA